jgi:hypothetical protein
MSTNPWEGMLIKMEYRDGKRLKVVYYNGKEIGTADDDTAAKKLFIEHTGRKWAMRRY